MGAVALGVLPCEVLLIPPSLWYLSATPRPGAVGCCCRFLTGCVPFMVSAMSSKGSFCLWEGAVCDDEPVGHMCETGPSPPPLLLASWERQWEAVESANSFACWCVTSTTLRQMSKSVQMVRKGWKGGREAGQHGN